ncbi:WD repeat protein [Niveomyces insectorum RCEF 264]|uniref:Mitochondrial division protein 1 n=1 Tax=Niveomyces insectorum RCEF 264 TaxID=1081102 RepID=A0A168AEU4_9HYPO|nr:WD repeat protein [Niveomyces insectorum RCEF 264]
MAPVEVAVPLEHPAKRRKVRNVDDGDGDGDGNNVVAKKQALKQKRPERLSIRARQRRSPALSPKKGKDGKEKNDDDDDDDDDEDQDETGEKAKKNGERRGNDATRRKSVTTGRRRATVTVTVVNIAIKVSITVAIGLRTAGEIKVSAVTQQLAIPVPVPVSVSIAVSIAVRRKLSYPLVLRVTAAVAALWTIPKRPIPYFFPLTIDPAEFALFTTFSLILTLCFPPASQRRRHPHPRPPPRPHYRRVFAMRGHEGPVSQVRISPDGRWIASASADATARIWDAATGAHITTLVGHVAGLSCLAWSPDSNTLATGSDDKSIRLWDRVTGEPAHALVHMSSPADGETDGNANANADENANGGMAALDFELQEGENRRGTAAATARYARRLRDGVNGANAHGGGSGGARGTRLPLLGHHNYVYCLAFSPKGNILASGSYDEAVFLWDVRAGRLMRSLPAHSDPVSGIDFCCDGTLVVSCSTDGLIRIWDTGTGQCLRTLLLLDEDNPAVTNVCFSPNGRYVLAFNLDSCIRLWDYIAQPSVVKKTYQGHVNKGFSIGGCFGVLGTNGGARNDDGVNGSSSRNNNNNKSKRYCAFVAAASEDGDVVLWDVGTKAVVQRLRGAHRGGVCFWVDVCGTTMVSCGQDGWINVYRHKDTYGGDDDDDHEDQGDEDGVPKGEERRRMERSNESDQDEHGDRHDDSDDANTSVDKFVAAGAADGDIVTDSRHSVDEQA